MRCQVKFGPPSPGCKLPAKFKVITSDDSVDVCRDHLPMAVTNYDAPGVTVVVEALQPNPGYVYRMFPSTRPQPSIPHTVGQQP